MAGKKGLAFFKKKKNPEGGVTGFVSSLVPTIPSDLKDFAIPVGVSFASARIIDRVSRRILATRFPRLAKHAGPLSGVATTVALYFATEKIPRLRKYQTGALIGASLSLLISIIQTYIPKLASFLGINPTMQLSAPVPVSSRVVDDEYSEFDEEPMGDDAQYDNVIPAQQALPDSNDFPEPGMNPVDDEIPVDEESMFSKSMFS